MRRMMRSSLLMSIVVRYVPLIVAEYFEDVWVMVPMGMAKWCDGQDRAGGSGLQLRCSVWSG